MRNRKKHLSKIDRIVQQLEAYPTKEEKIWVLLTLYLKDITYEDYLVIYNKI
jgi:hypothetical protein